MRKAAYPCWPRHRKDISMGNQRTSRYQFFPDVVCRIFALCCPQDVDWWPMNSPKESSTCHRLRAWATALWPAESVFWKRRTVQHCTPSEACPATWFTAWLPTGNWQYIALFTRGKTFRPRSGCSWMLLSFRPVSSRFGTQRLRRIRDHLCGNQAAEDGRFDGRTLRVSVSFWFQVLSYLHYLVTEKLGTSWHLVTNSFSMSSGIGEFQSETYSTKQRIRSVCIQWLAGGLDTPGSRAIAREIL